MITLSSSTIRISAAFKACFLLVRLKTRGERVSALLLVHVAVQVSAHGVLDALSCNQEDGAPADVHTVVGDALQVVDHKSSSHPPLRCPTGTDRRVGYEVHGLGVEEVHLIVFR